MPARASGSQPPHMPPFSAASTQNLRTKANTGEQRYLAPAWPTNAVRDPRRGASTEMGRGEQATAMKGTHLGRLVALSHRARSDDMLDTHVEAGILLQGLRRAVEQEGVNVYFIKVKGHMDDHKGFIDKFRCAKGNKLADDYATKGMQAETRKMPYKMEGLPQYISGETTTR